jgi:hypothetical protein
LICMLDTEIEIRRGSWSNSQSISKSFENSLPILTFLQDWRKVVLQQLPISTLNLSTLGKIDPIVRKYRRAYRWANLEVEGCGKNKELDRILNANVEEKKV